MIARRQINSSRSRRNSFYWSSAESGPRRSTIGEWSRGLRKRPTRGRRPVQTIFSPQIYSARSRICKTSICIKLKGQWETHKLSVWQYLIRNYNSLRVPMDKELNQKSYDYLLGRLSSGLKVVSELMVNLGELSIIKVMNFRAPTARKVSRVPQH